MLSAWSRRVLLGFVALTAAALVVGTPATAATFPGNSWTKATPQSQNVDPVQLNQGIAVAKNRGGQGMIVRNGFEIASWGSITKKNTLASASKSWSSLLTGLAIADHVIPSQGSRAQAVYPDFVQIPNPNSTTNKWLSQITIHQLLTMTAGFGTNSFDGFGSLKFAPGSTWFYSNSAVDALGDVVTYAYNRDLLDVLRTRILRPIGVGDAEVSWTTNAQRTTKINGKPDRNFAGGIIANINAMARVGLLMLNHGNWKGRQLIPSAYVADVTRPHADVARTTLRDSCPALNRTYGLLWFTNALRQMPHVPKDAFWQWGNSDRITLVVPSLRLVVARTGGEFPYKVCYEGIESFFDPVIAAMH
jgi:CubicO group peptidase (beta-lactamase class C family)